jgi:hypothetical protein
VLELGPGKHTIVLQSDVMVKPEDDVWGKPENEVGNFIVHDATEVPWSISEKQYDLFIALQVWEHLGSRQRQVFNEVM